MPPMYEKKAALEAVGKGGDGSVNNRKTVGQLFGKDVGSSPFTSQ